MVICRPPPAVSGGVFESFTETVKRELVTAAVGVPLIKPVDAFSVKPPGNEPEVKVQV
jgi:hypothetical protein